MSFSTYKDLVSVSDGTFTGAAGTAINTSLRNLAGTLYNRALDVKVMFGATGDGSTDDTASVHAALDAALADGGGAVYLPPGSYSCDPLPWYPSVSLIGAGIGFDTQTLTGSSIIKARSAGSLLSSYNDPRQTPVGIIAGIDLDGNSVGTIGLDVSGMPFLSLYKVQARSFTTGFKMRGILIAFADQCRAIRNVTGIDGDSSAGFNANLVRFTNCSVQYNTTVGLKWNHGSMIGLHGCDFELNGTNGGTSTGSIQVSNTNPSGEGIGLVVSGCWFERNWGHSHIRINPAGNAQGYAAVIRDTLINFAPATGTAATYGIWVDGSGTATKVKCDAVSIGSTGAGTSAYLSGAAATLYSDTCDFASTGGTGTILTATYA